MTVYLASVLFLVGISTHFPVRARARYGLLVIGGVILDRVGGTADRPAEASDLNGP